MTDARITQELIEQWTSNAAARTTTIMVEHWVNPNVSNVIRAIATQVCVEHWVAVAPPPSAQPPRAWILA